MAMQTAKSAQEPLLPLFVAWARYHLAQRLAAIRPALTAEHAAVAAALSNNPSGA
jgi:hypothetical protein